MPEPYQSTLTLNHELGSVGDVLNELGCKPNTRVRWNKKKVWACDYIYRLIEIGWSIDSAGKQLIKDLDEQNAKAKKEKEVKQACGFGHVTSLS